ncbi:hypothetical protein BV898_14771 [Hypsibius exemplaris]|uniref:Cystatin domain-containing protein n=1 Tax=Hypsibius exemplaris TaxID=2072580 RepID=A0A9X6NBJ9_HYPEX|nr:hypothetical protein BV898_14771 [Hypsibius exemplaris]
MEHCLILTVMAAAFVVLLSLASVECDSSLGRLSSSRKADPESRKLATEVRATITARSQQNDNTPLTHFTVITYKTQTVGDSGVNYFVKIQVNDSTDKGYVHAKIFRGQDGSARLDNLLTGRSDTDPIQAF